MPPTPTTTQDALAKLACHWTTILDLEISSDQVGKCLEALSLIAPHGSAVVFAGATNVSFLTAEQLEAAHARATGRGSDVAR